MKPIDWLIEDKLKSVVIKDAKDWECFRLTDNVSDAQYVEVFNDTDEEVFVDSVSVFYGRNVDSGIVITWRDSGGVAKHQIRDRIFKRSTTASLCTVQLIRPWVMKANESVSINVYDGNDLLTVTLNCRK